MKILQLFLILTVSLLLFPGQTYAEATSFGPGDLVKIEGNTAVYYVGQPLFEGGFNTRYAFPNDKVYFSWYADFSLVKTISSDELATMRLVENITYRPGTRLVKVTTVPSVYAVGAGGLLRLIESEEQAIALYGVDWADRVDDVPDVFWLNYSLGEPISDSVLPNETLAKEIGGSQTFLIENGNKRKLAGSAFDLNRYQGIHVVELDSLDQYPAGVSIDQDEAHRLDAAQKTAAPDVEPPIVEPSDEAPVSVWQTATIATDEFKSFYDPSLAWNGDGWGIIWTDANENAAGNVYFARVSATGDTQGETLLVNKSLAKGGMPDIVWNGDEYAVVFSDKSSGALPAVYFARITAAGSLIGEPTQISSGSGNDLHPQIVWNGTGYAASWVSSNCTINCGIRFLLIDKDGNPLGSEFQVNDHSLTLKPNRPALAWSGSGYGVVWQAPGNNLALSVIYFRNISESGKKENKELNINKDLKWSSHPSLVWNGSEFLVTHARNVNELAAEAQIVRVSSVGIKVDFPRVFNDQLTAVGPVNVVWTGTEYGLSWTDNAQGAGLESNIYFTKLTSLGADIDADILISHQGIKARDSDLSFGNDKWGVAWEEESEQGRKEIILGFTK